MATQGGHIFDGYVKNIGMVRVYSDLDNPKFVFATSVKTGEEYFMIRTRVQPRKTGKENNPVISVIKEALEAPVQGLLF